MTILKELRLGATPGAIYCCTFPNLDHLEHKY